MQLRFRAADPNGAGPWRYLVDWGDGSTHRRSDGTLGLVAVRHVYRSAGQYLVSVTATDQADRSGSDTLTVFVEPKDAPQVFVGAGDVGTCAKGYPLATGRLLDTIPGTVFLLGDDAYPDGSDSSYRRCFQPGWGRHRKRIHPVPGNHDYKTPGAAGYFRYFGVAAGDPATGYYSYDLGAWHVVALNSNLDMRAGSAQEQWLRADLAAHPARCTIAYWHIPRFSSGTTHGSSTLPQPLWQALYDYGAELVLVGHEHNYERFAPQKPDGTLDPGRGIRQFVVGTGGAGSYPFGTPLPNSEVRTWTHGVLKLTLADGSYTWEFVPVAGQTFRDSGTGSCH